MSALVARAAIRDYGEHRVVPSRPAFPAPILLETSTRSPGRYTPPRPIHRFQALLCGSPARDDRAGVSRATRAGVNPATPTTMYAPEGTRKIAQRGPGLNPATPGRSDSAAIPAQHRATRAGGARQRPGSQWGRAGTARPHNEGRSEPGNAWRISCLPNFPDTAQREPGPNQATPRTSHRRPVPPRLRTTRAGSKPATIVALDAPEDAKQVPGRTPALPTNLRAGPNEDEIAQRGPGRTPATPGDVTGSA